MSALEDALKHQDYHVINSPYDSRHAPVEVLAETALTSALAGCAAAQAKPVNVVTHSLGGILVREYFTHHSPQILKRVVMLGPPNQGSQVVDHLQKVPGFNWINGPAGAQLGTDKHSVPLQLGPVNFYLGIIAGTKTFNPFLSLYLPNPDDGKVSVENTKVAGMCAHLALPVTHTFMMKNTGVIAEVIYFLQTGKFKSGNATYYCSSDDTSAVTQGG